MPPKKLTDIVTDYYSNGNPLSYVTGTDYPIDINVEMSQEMVLDDERTMPSHGAKKWYTMIKKPLTYSTTIPLDGMTVYAVLNGRNAGLILGQVIQKLIDKVIFNDPATIIKWKDGTKTVVKCRQSDTYNRKVGFMMCIMKYLCGNKSNATKKFIAEYCGEDEKNDSINNADNDEIDYEQEERRLTRNCHIVCADCRLSKYRNGTTLPCHDFCNDHYDEYKQIIRKWAKDCPATKDGYIY